MRRVLVLAAVTAIAVARPELYKEKEDFQYSRSSTDEGNKSGFYGAQRGNMGGNYERAHNMDGLAQHQMSGLVRNVEGELGDGAKQNSGSVFTAANSRGVFGSGHYDLSNLEGRNFQEGTNLGDSQSHSSLTSQSSGYRGQWTSSNSGGYRNTQSQSQNSRYNGFNGAGSVDQALYTSSHHGSDNLQAANQYQGIHTAHNSGYHSQAGYHGQAVYDQAAANSQSANGYRNVDSTVRLVSATPVRVIVRPGGRVAIPVAAQTFDNSQASSFDHNAINSEAEVLGNNDQQTGYRQNGNGKHYESSYSYRKEWEKHDTKPVGVGIVAPAPATTVNPYPANSELYEDTQAHVSKHNHESSGVDAQNTHSSHQYSGFNVKSATSGQSSQQAAYNTQLHNSGSNIDEAYRRLYNNRDQSASLQSAASTALKGSNNYGEALSNGAYSNLNSQVEDFSNKPKSYQSSFSYHKSWERQGDPYVIKPATNGVYSAVDGQTSQKLTAGSSNVGTYASHQYGSNYHQGHASNSEVDCDCDYNGHARIARSANFNQAQTHYQQSEDIFQGQEDFGQQPQNLEDFGQQSQNLEDLGQQTQNFEDLGQQSQSNWDQIEDGGQKPQAWDLSQQSQNKLDKLEDLGQQTQNKWDRIEDLGQQTQNQWGQEELGQQVQNKWDKMEDLGQQTQNTWEQSQNLGQQIQNMNEGLSHQQNANTGFETQETMPAINKQNETEPLSTQHVEESHGPHHVPSVWDMIGQEKSNTSKDKDITQTAGAGQETENTWDHSQSVDVNNGNEFTQMWHQTSQREDHNQYVPPHSVWDIIGDVQSNTDRRNDFMQASGGGHEINTQENRGKVFVPLWSQPMDTNLGNVNTGSGYYNHHEHFNVNDYSRPWTYDSTYQHHAYDSPWMYNMGSNTQQRWQYHSTNTNNEAHSNYNTHFLNTNSQPNAAGSTSLSSLWDKLDNIEKQTTYSGGMDGNDHTKLFHENTDKYLNINNNPEERPVQSSVLIPTVTTTKISNIETTTVKQHNIVPEDEKRGDIDPEDIPSSEDVGRGDIGPLDTSSFNTYKPVNSKPFKTNDEIETLSLTKEASTSTPAIGAIDMQNTEKHNQSQNSNNIEEELSVLGLKDEKELENSVKLEAPGRTTSTTPKSNYHYVQESHVHEEHIIPSIPDTDRFLRPHVIISTFTTSTTPRNGNKYISSNTHSESGPEQIEQQNMDEQFKNLVQQNENLNQQTYNGFLGIGQQNTNLDQQSMDHDVGFGQENTQIGHENIEPLENFNQRNLGHHDQDQSLVDFGQQSENIGQENVEQQFENFDHNIRQQNMDHQMVDFGQQSEMLGQEPMEQNLESFGQQSEVLGQEPMEQNLESFGQQSEGFQQENIRQFGQQEENIGQKEQNLENWDQVSHNLGQPKKDEAEDLGQQVQTAWKPSDNIQQITQQHDQVETFVPPSHNKEYREPVVEPEVVTKKTIIVESPPEMVTEKVGFWKSVGSKFTSAKDKVSSWFSS